MLRAGRLIAWGLCILVCGVLAALALTDLPADPDLYPPRPPDPGVEIYVVDYGLHTGIALPRAALADAGSEGLTALADVAQRFAAYDVLEIGWGEEEFYRTVPTLAALHVDQALRALLLPGNRSVLHVVGLDGAIAAAYPRATIIPVRLSVRGFRRLARGWMPPLLVAPTGRRSMPGPVCSGRAVSF